jgi:hypothetical protein
MSASVDILVTFPSSRADGVAAVAQRHLPEVRRRQDEELRRELAGGRVDPLGDAPAAGAPDAAAAAMPWDLSVDVERLAPGELARAAAPTFVPEAVVLLEDLARGRGYARGRHGGGFAWRVTGSSLDPAAFVGALHDFWQELLQKRLDKAGWRGPLSTDRVLVFYQGPNDLYAAVLEIRSAEPWTLTPRPRLEIVHHAELPVSLT